MTTQFNSPGAEFSRNHVKSLINYKSIDCKNLNSILTFPPEKFLIKKTSLIFKLLAQQALKNICGSFVVFYVKPCCSRCPRCLKGRRIA